MDENINKQPEQDQSIPIQNDSGGQPVWNAPEKPAQISQSLDQDFPSKPSAFSPKNILKLLIGVFAVLVLIFVLFTLVFSNIGKGTDKTTLSYWGVLEDSNVIAPVILEFEKENPTITVDYIKQDIKDYKNKLSTRISQGTGPDVFSFQNTWYMALSQVLLALPSDTISKDSFNQLFYPVMKKDLIQNGGIYGIPLGVDTLSLFVNTEIFKQAGVSVPKNWNDFINASRTLTVKDQTGKIKTSGTAMGAFDNVNHASDIISLLFVQDGVDLSNLANSKDRISDALRFYTAFSLGDGSVWDKTLDPSLLAFSKGNLAMYFGYYWDYFAIKQASPSLSFTIESVPQLNFQSPTIANYYAEGVSSKSKNQKEALLFMKFLARKDIQEKLLSQEAKVRTYPEPPSIMSLSDNLQNSPLFVISLQAKNATSSYFAGEPVDNNLKSYLSNAVNSMLGNTLPDSAADTLISSVSQTLSQYSQK